MIFSLACQREAPKPEPEPAPLRGDGRLNIYALDVGQGDSLLVISPGGKTVLIDAGPVEAGDEVVAALNQHGVKILDLVVATHPHADHIGGMRRVMQNFKVRKFLDSGQTHSSETYERMLGEIQERKISFIKARKGQNIEIEPNVRLEVLNPGKEFFTEVRSGGSALNANSIVLRLSYDDFAMLFTGDAEFETEALMMNAGATLKAQVLKIGHHGSRHATSGKFLAAVAPKAAIISDGETNDYGHPSQFTLDRLRRAKVQVYRTDLHGEIAIVTDGKAFEIKPSRKASLTAVWLGRQPPHSTRSALRPADHSPEAHSGLMTKRKVKHAEPAVVFVDRIEDGVAIITFSDDDNIHFNLPLKYLPADVSEGDHFTLTFQPDPEQTEAVGQRVTELQEELSGHDEETNIRL